MIRSNREHEFSVHEILSAVKQGVNCNLRKRNFSDEIILIKGCVELIDVLIKEVVTLKLINSNQPISTKKKVDDKHIPTKKPVVVADYIEELMLKKGKPLTISDIHKDIFRLGYKTTSKFPYEVIRSSIVRDGRFFKCDNYGWYIRKSS